MIACKVLSYSVWSLVMAHETAAVVGNNNANIIPLCSSPFVNP